MNESLCCRLIFCLAAVLVLLPFSVVARAEEGAEEAQAAAENEAPAPIDDGKPMQATVEILVLEYANNTMFDLGTSGIYTRREDNTTGGVSVADLVFPSFSSGGLGLGMLLDNISIGEGEFQFVIQALERDENLEILSRPTLLLERGGQEASVVQTVDKVPYETNKVVGTTVVKPTDFKEAGVRLAVRLADIHEVGPGEYYLDLELDTGVRAVGPRLPVAHAEPPEGSVIEVPEFFSRSIKTKVAVRDRQILVIGALLSKEKYKSERKLPILGNIPVLKYLFSSRREEERYRELIFFVRPRVDLGGYVQQPSFPDDALGSGDEQ